MYCIYSDNNGALRWIWITIRDEHFLSRIVQEEKEEAEAGGHSVLRSHFTLKRECFKRNAELNFTDDKTRQDSI